MKSNISVTKQTNRNTHIKIEFQNSIERLSFLCCTMDIKIAWINPCTFKKFMLPFRQYVSV